MKAIINLTAGLLILACVTACNRDGKQDGQQKWSMNQTYPDKGGITLDADISGTEVFLKEKNLGKVPVTLSAKDLIELGIANPRVEKHASLDISHFYVYILGDESSVASSRENIGHFMFLAPKNVRANYVSVETPWGIRTQFGGCSTDIFTNLCVYLVKPNHPPGLSLAIESLEKTSIRNSSWKLKAVLTSHAPISIVGFRPEIEVSYFKFHPLAMPIGRTNILLPKEWAAIKPGQTLETEITIEPPKTKGDFAMKAWFTMLKDDTLDKYTNMLSWVPSNTKLFSVK